MINFFQRCEEKGYPYTTLKIILENAQETRLYPTDLGTSRYDLDIIKLWQFIILNTTYSVEDTTIRSIPRCQLARLLITLPWKIMSDFL